MNLSYSDSQTAIADLAKRIFEGSSPDDVWAELAKAGLIGAGVPEDRGGIGGGMLEIATLLEEFGKNVSHVPLLWHVIACAVLEQTSDSTMTVAFGDAISERNNALAGSISAMPYATTASRALISAGSTYLIDLDHPSVTIEPQTVTTGEPFGRVTFDGTPAQPVEAPLLREKTLVGMCAVAAGITDRALHLTAEHLKVREQFGRPLGTFQAVQQRMADAYIDVEAMRWTMWQAAWRLDEGLPAEVEIAVAKYWAAEGGHRVLAAAQHLHGGLGVDVDYPLHRYTTAGKLIEMTLGSAPEQLAILGDLIA